MFAEARVTADAILGQKVKRSKVKVNEATPISLDSRTENENDKLQKFNFIRGYPLCYRYVSN